MLKTLKIKEKILGKNSCYVQIALQKKGMRVFVVI